MMGRKSGFYLAAALLLTGIAAALRAQDQNAANDDHAQAVNAVRLINTAELWYNKGTKKDASDAHNRYTSLADLNQSGVLKAVQDKWTMVKDLQLSPKSEVIPGHRLDLLVSPDGKSYSLALHDMRDRAGLFSVFSDQDGIIFLGSPLQ